MKTLYLHIGTAKTGTTSIQYFCCQNQAVFEKKSYCYPEFPYTYPGRHRRRNGLFLTSPCYDQNMVRQKDREKEIFREGLDTVAQLFQQYDNIILSDESIWWASNSYRKGLWKQLLTESKRVGYTVKVIVYFRRQDKFMDSQWNQRIKHSYFINGSNSLTWDEFSGEYHRYIFPDYYAGVKRIASILGHDNIIVRRFDRKEFIGGSLQADFLNAIGLDMTEEYALDEDSSNLNLRIQGNALEFRRLSNQVPMSRKEHLQMGEIVAACSDLMQESASYSTMSAEEAKAFMAQFDEGNRKLAEEFIGDGRPMFSEDYPETVKWMPDNPYMQADMIRYMAVSNLYLMRQIEELRQQTREDIRKNRSFVLRVWQKLKRIFHR